MTKTYKITEHERLRFALLCSIVVHIVIIAVVFWNLRQTNLQFKKGTGEIPNKIKISGFLPQQSPTQGTNQNTTQAQQITSAQKSQNKNTTQPPSTTQTSNIANRNSKPLDSHPTQNTTHTQTQENIIDSINLHNLTLNNPSSNANNAMNSHSRKKGQSPSLAAIFSHYPKLDDITKRDVNDLYGEEFGDYGLVEQDFIINNLRDIGRITGKYLKYPQDAIRLGQQGVNIVQFYLHPNGDITDLRLIKSSGYVILDRNSERTIEIAYKDYPHPTSTVLIRIRVSMELYYY